MDHIAQQASRDLLTHHFAGEEGPFSKDRNFAGSRGGATPASRREPFVYLTVVRKTYMDHFWFDNFYRMN